MLGLSIILQGFLILAQKERRVKKQTYAETHDDNEL